MPLLHRTGKCKERQRCKFVHDPGKVAVCPKWLQSRCEDAACPLQHQLRPELMPVCTFFLQVSLCSSVIRSCGLSVIERRFQLVEWMWAHT